MSSSAGVALPETPLDALVLGPGSKGVEGYGVGAEEGPDEAAGVVDSEIPRISAIAEADLDARFLDAICLPRKAARGLSE